MQTVIVLPYKRVNGLCTSLSRGEQVALQFSADTLILYAAKGLRILRQEVA
jgi:hypothetical protein